MVTHVTLFNVPPPPAALGRELPERSGRLPLLPSAAPGSELEQ